MQYTHPTEFGKKGIIRYYQRIGGEGANLISNSKEFHIWDATTEKALSWVTAN